MSSEDGIERVLSDRLSAPIGSFVHAIVVPPGAGLMFLSGLTARAEDGSTSHIDDVTGQTARILENMIALLGERNLSLADVVKVVVYVRHMEHLQDIHQVRHEYFGATMPASTLVEVSDFVSPDMLLEIDAIAVVPAERQGTSVPGGRKEDV